MIESLWRQRFYEYLVKSSPSAGQLVFLSWKKDRNLLEVK
jgi:hypothetical protein